MIAERLERPLAAGEESVAFVRLGLRSLDLVRLVDGLGQRLGLTLPASLVFDCTTPAALAAHLREEHAAAVEAFSAVPGAGPAPVPAAAAGPPLPEASVSDRQEAAAALAPAPVETVAAEAFAQVPLTVSQQGIWVLQQTHPAMAAYNVPLCLRVALPDEAAVARVRRICGWIGGRWPLLGASIGVSGGRPVFRIGAGSGLPLEERAAEGWSEAERVAWLRERGKRPFDLAAGPLARLHLLTDRAAGCG